MSEPTKTEDADFDDPITLNPVIGISPEDLVKAGAKVLQQAVVQPMLAIEQFAKLNQELVRIATGSSTLEASAKDRRFADEAFSNDGVAKLSKGAWLAWQQNLNDWVDRSDLTGVDQERARFVVNLVADALAPTNFLLGNPSALREARRTRGHSIARGFVNFLDDMVNNHQMPSQVDKSAFDVGRNLATTPGSVVFRNDLIELIQYSPTTAEVASRPVFIVPPQINKYYLYDLSPEKSVVRYLVEQGQQVFVVSWRNPYEDLSHCGLEDYVESIGEALRAALDITHADSANVVGACAGGITLTLALGYFEAQDWHPANSLTLMVNVLSFGADDSVMSLFATKESIDLARKRSQATGYLDGYQTAKVFNWMRPNDLIWNYVAANYLHGEGPPKFDVLYWNNDCTRLPSQLHADFLDLFEGKSLANAGEIKVGDTPIDLQQTKFDVFITAGTTDHITPWKACYRSVPLFGGDVDFLLSSAGHIQSVLNPPGNPRSKYWQNSQTSDDADDWFSGADEHKGSWWEYWSDWLTQRGDGSKPAPAETGNKTHPPLCAAPGTYVLE